ncbi:MAG: hypothetical protein IKD80_06325 [Selenomonadaceae bacterium]|nr:hypothetical protein [Selenomonadaceae bacterium]
MKKFLILDADSNEVAETSYGNFTAAIAQLGAAPATVYVVHVSTLDDKGNVHTQACAVYSDIHAAADSVAALHEFAFNVQGDNEAFCFEGGDVSPLDVLNVLDEILSADSRGIRHVQQQRF